MLCLIFKLLDPCDRKALQPWGCNTDPGKTGWSRAGKTVKIQSYLIATGITFSAVFLQLFVGLAVANETDQYYAWGRELDDATEIINAKFHLEIQRGLDELNREVTGRDKSCEAVAKVVKQRLKFWIFHDIEIWALHADALQRLPATAEEVLNYRATYLYHRKGFLDISDWIPPSPTIEVNGIRFGTDKLAHFVSTGWRYYCRYRRALESGLSPKQAERHAIDLGLFLEKTRLGIMVSGAFSLGDMEANYNGLKFYLDLCESDDPIVTCRRGEWRMRRPFDIRDYVSVEWDESFHPSILTRRRWQLTKPVLESYRMKMSDPEVRQQRNIYRKRDCVTLSEEVVAELVRQGKLADPQQFGLDWKSEALDAVDGAGRIDPIMVGAEVPSKSYCTDGSTWPDEALLDELLRKEQQRKRVTVGTLGVSRTYPEKWSASAGILFARMPEEYDPHILCLFEGPFVQMQVGIGGARGSIGWAKLYGETSHNDFLLREYFLGYGFKASAMRTNNNADSRESGQVFAGMEVELTLFRFNFEMGIFYQVGGPDKDEPWMITGGIGFGF